MKIAICDDQMETAHHIEDIVEKFFQKEMSCEVFFNGSELIEYIAEKGNDFNIYLLDIEMPGHSGIETAFQIRQKDKNAIIIFITDHKEYVFQVFEVLPFRFLQKPVIERELFRVLKDAVAHIKETCRIFFFQIGHNKYQLPYHEILFFEGAGRKVKIHTEQGVYEIYNKISAIKNTVDATQFCQAHGSYIVNMAYIRSIQKNQILLQNGTLIPVSKKYLHEVRHAHLIFIERKSGKHEYLFSRFYRPTGFLPGTASRSC